MIYGILGVLLPILFLAIFGGNDKDNSHKIVDLKLTVNQLNSEIFKLKVELYKDEIEKYLKYRNYIEYQITSSGVMFLVSTIKDPHGFQDTEYLTIEEIIKKNKEYDNICCKKGRKK